MARHDELNPTQKAESLENAVSTLRFLVRNGFQGNVAFPIYDGGVGKIHAELFMEPKLIPKLIEDKKLREGEKKDATG